MKNYCKPICKVKNIIIETPVLATSNPTIDDGTHPDKDTTPLTRGRRGSWGDLWYEGDTEENR